MAKKDHMRTLGDKCVEYPSFVLVTYLQGFNAIDDKIKYKTARIPLKGVYGIFVIPAVAACIVSPLAAPPVHLAETVVGSVKRAVGAEKS